jgi:peptidoglycan/xylan/chitin deacetylase (PgdA/CDA1 family)
MSKHWQPTILIHASVALHAVALVALIAVPTLWPWILASIITNHIVITALGLWPRSHLLGPNLTRLPAAATARNEIALTIDDGPDPLVTPEVLDILDHYSVKATFFCIADHALRFPELCREIIRRGHTIENHSQHHRHNFSLLGYSGIKREVQAAQDTLTNITGQRPLFFRAPAGLRNVFLDPVLTQLGLRLATWSVRGFDTQVGDTQQVKNKLLAGLHPGAILLMHDGNSAFTPQGNPIIVEVLPSLLAAAKARDLHFVTLQQAVS